MIGSAARDAVFDGASLVKSGSPSTLTLTQKIAGRRTRTPTAVPVGRDRHVEGLLEVVVTFLNVKQPTLGDDAQRHDICMCGVLPQSTAEERLGVCDIPVAKASPQTLVTGSGARDPQHYGTLRKPCVYEGI